MKVFFESNLRWSAPELLSKAAQKAGVMISNTQRQGDKINGWSIDERGCFVKESGSHVQGETWHNVPEEVVTLLAEKDEYNTRATASRKNREVIAFSKVREQEEDEDTCDTEEEDNTENESATTRYDEIRNRIQAFHTESSTDDGWYTVTSNLQ